MKKKLGILAFMILVIIMTACTHIQPENTGIGDNDMTIQRMFEYLSQERITLDDFFELLQGKLETGEIMPLFENMGELLEILDYQTQDQVIDRLMVMLFGEPTEEELNARREELQRRLEEEQRTNLEYIVSGSYQAANRDVDLQTIDRFVFTDSVDPGIGLSLVIDRMYGSVYFDTQLALIFRSIGQHEFSAKFQPGDLEHLISSIELSGLWDWQEQYTATTDSNALGGFRLWRIGVLFSDGTILRRSGSGMWGDENMFPPDGQFDIMLDFIRTFGAEIEARHNERIAADE